MDSDTQSGCFGGFFARRGRQKDSRNEIVARPASSLSSCDSFRGKREDTNEKKKEPYYRNAFRDFAYGSESDWWTIGLEGKPPPYVSKVSLNDKPGDIVNDIERSLDERNDQLRELSLKIHDHPETHFHEKFAHDLLTSYLKEQGFTVTPHYLGLPTAWRAVYSQGEGGRVIGINSEMDALPQLGHACGHNLIAIAGVGVAIALKTALEARKNIPGKIVLLGTPAEEEGGGKVILLERGAYKEMDICLMCHPTAGPVHSVSLGSTASMQTISAEFFGHSAHAGQAPWEGTNALDAAMLAYSSVSMLRQQMKPDHRINGIIEGKNWVPNVIPDYAKTDWITRAPTSQEVTELTRRVFNCLKAAGLATGCEVEIKTGVAYFDLRQNSVLGQAFNDIVSSRYGLSTVTTAHSASTDFGNVSYVLPSLHPNYAIPTVDNGGNHTPRFTKAARSEEAHKATIIVAKGLALTGYRALIDDEFLLKVKASFDSFQLR